MGEFSQEDIDKVTALLREAKKGKRDLDSLMQEAGTAAQVCLGEMYEEGKGVRRNYRLAVEWYRKAAEQGNDYAQCNLGECYENGDGVTKDISEAVKWYRKAAAQGNPYAKDNLKRLGYSE